METDGSGINDCFFNFEARLASITSKSEQEFLTNWLFDVEKVETKVRPFSGKNR